MQADVALAHLSLDLRLGDQRRHRVHDNDVDGSGTYHRIRDLKSLLAVVRLGNIQFVDIHAEILRVDRIQRVLRVNESSDSASLLRLRDHMQRDCGLTA